MHIIALVVFVALGTILYAYSLITKLAHCLWAGEILVRVILAFHKPFNFQFNMDGKRMGNSTCIASTNVCRELISPQEKAWYFLTVHLSHLLLMVEDFH